MKLLHFLRKESSAPLRRLAVMAGLSGLASVLILAIINVGVRQAADEGPSLTHLLMFLIVIAIYIVSQRYLMIETMSQVEQILHRVRVRIVDKVRSCDLEPLDQLGRAEIYTSLSRETQTISQASTVLVLGMQSAVLVFFAVFYLAWLSLTAFVCFAVVCALAVAIQLRLTARFQQDILQAMEHENKLLDTLAHMLDGFTEIKLNPRRSDDLYEHLQRISDSALALRIRTNTQFAKTFIVGQAMFYVLVAAMIFVVPWLSTTYNAIIVQAAIAILFLTGPIQTLATSIPNLANTNAAITKLEALEAQLDAAVRRRGDGPEARIAPFDDIRFQRIVFQFHHTQSKRPFTLGPIDLTLTNGETVFIVGGNGSGKSTLLRLLTALYDPDEGLVRINGKPVGEDNLQAYRNLFSVIFSDFHLFDRLYGMGDTDEKRVAALLEEMELAHKTSYQDGEFSTLDLSSGQKKRMAYVVSLLEDRPIYVFDEWAAGQDPEFRKKFYHELLPRLKQRGKTIVAVTHDDRYWDVADRRLKMDEGRFVEA